MLQLLTLGSLCASARSETSQRGQTAVTLTQGPGVIQPWCEVATGFMENLSCCAAWGLPFQSSPPKLWVGCALLSVQPWRAYSLRQRGRRCLVPRAAQDCSVNQCQKRRARVSNDKLCWHEKAAGWNVGSLLPLEMYEKEEVGSTSLCNKNNPGNPSKARCMAQATGSGSSDKVTVCSPWCHRAGKE